MLIFTVKIELPNPIGKVDREEIESARDIQAYIYFSIV